MYFTECIPKINELKLTDYAVVYTCILLINIGEYVSSNVFSDVIHLLIGDYLSDACI